MANPETIIISIRRRCTEVFEACQDNLDAAQQDETDLVAEEGEAFFRDWFNTTTGYDIAFDDLVAAMQALASLKATFDQVRGKLQIVRIR